MTVLESETLIITSLYPLAEHLRRDYWQFGAADAVESELVHCTVSRQLQLAFFDRNDSSWFDEEHCALIVEA